MQGSIKLWLLAGACALCLPGLATADEAELDALIVTAPRLEDTLPQIVARYGSDLAVVSPEVLRDNAYIDVTQALQMQTPGLYIMPGNGPFSYVDLSLQGSRTGDVLWVVDGVRINNRLYTSTSPTDTLPASMIERIEVLKGGQGLLYGSQAAAGVINIVTRPYGDEGVDGGVTVGGHTNGGLHADGYARASVGAHRFVAWLSKDKADGYTTYDVFQPSTTARKRAYDVLSFGGKYGLQFNEDLSLNLYYQHTEAKVDNPGARLVNTKFNDRDEEIASVSLDWKPSEEAQVSVKGYYHDWDTVYTTINNVPGKPGQTVVVDDKTYWGFEDFGVSALARLNFHKGFEYQLGYDFQNFNGRDDVLLIAQRTEKVHAFVGQILTTDDLIRNARFSAGVRYNKTGGAESTVWNLSGRWEPGENLYVEAVGGTSFILPSAEQLFGVDPCCAIGNPNLGPEESLNFNGSVGGFALDRRLVWQVTGFARKIDNLITADYSRSAYPDGVYMNADRQVKVRGAEVQATFAVTPELTAQASFTYTRSRAAGSSQQFDRTPEYYAKGGLTYSPQDKPYGLSVSAAWTGDVYQTVSGFGRQNYGGFVIVDLSGHVYLDEKRSRRLTARLENAFDEEYATRVSSGLIDLSTQRFMFRSLGPPRTLHVSFTQSF